MSNTFPWQHSYQNAMLELNLAELPAKIKIALGELRERRMQLMLSHDPVAGAEWQAIADAVNNLSVIERYELGSSANGNEPMSQMVYPRQQRTGTDAL